MTESSFGGSSQRSVPATEGDVTRYWKQNLTALWVVQFLTILGFTFVIPFVALYIAELGITDPREIAIWAGVLVSITSFCQIFSAPVWGRLADRYGRKLMLLRSLGFGILITAGMAFVPNVWVLLILRACQGIFSGAIAPSASLVATGTPEGRIGIALGSIQSAVYIGASLGPLVGGLIVTKVGFRSTFLAAASLLFGAFLLVLLLVREHFERIETPSRGLREVLAPFARLFTSRETATVSVVLLAVAASATTVSPIMPILVQSFHEIGSVAASVGWILGIAGFTSAIGAALTGRAGDYYGHRRVLGISLVGTAVTYVAQGLATSSSALLIERAVMGLMVGGILPTANVLLIRTVNRNERGSVLGVSQSATALGHAVGPILGSAVAATLGVPPVFMLTAILLLGAAIWVQIFVRPKSDEPTATGTVAAR